MIRKADLGIAVVIIGIILLIIVQLPPVGMDIMLIINISVSVMILMTALFVQQTLEFSVFPALLLITTIFRLALNLASTRLILGGGGYAGQVIKTFSEFVVQGNIVVGSIIFIIIIIIQFMVITKGAERVAEVAARFTLDAMPGKQMAIDADLNSGLIDEQGAKDRRLKIQREADFYGAMDGASKFVKGDAIVGIIIMFVNIIGGIIIGVINGGMELGDAAQLYTMATIGDGLVGQIPALLISTSMGIVVTRADSDGTLGSDFFSQLFSRPLVLYVTGGVVAVMALIPGMPWPLMIFMGAMMCGVGIIQQRKQVQPLPAEEDLAEAIAAEKRKPESVTTLLSVNLIEVEVGYTIIPMLDSSQGGDLLDRIVMIRRQSALDLGIVVPIIHFRDNIQIRPNAYLVKIKGVEVARGEIMTDHFLALNAGGAASTIQGIPTVDPAFGLPALWINEKDRERAELAGYTTIDTPSVIATHLTEIIKRYGHELMNRQQVQLLLDNLKQVQPALVEEVVPKMFSLGEMQKILAGLLKENIPIRDLGTILETISEFSGITHDADLLVEYVRQALKRTISRRFVPDNKAHVVTLDPSLERLIGERVRQTDTGSYVAMEPEYTQKILMGLKTAIERMTGMGITPIVLTSPNVRRHFKRMVDPMAPDLVVLSYNEIESEIEIFSDGMVSA